MWICVGPRDPATKPSRGGLSVVGLSAIPKVPPYNILGEEVITGGEFVSWAVAPTRGDTPASKMRIRPSSFGLCEVSGRSRSCLCLAGLSAYAKRFFPGRASCGRLWAIQQNSYVKLA